MQAGHPLPLAECSPRDQISPGNFHLHAPIMCTAVFAELQQCCQSTCNSSAGHSEASPVAMLPVELSYKFSPASSAFSLPSMPALSNLLANLYSNGPPVSRYRDPLASINPFFFNLSMPQDDRSPSMLRMVSLADYDGTPSGQYAATSLSQNIHGWSDRAMPTATFSLFGSNNFDKDYRDPLARFVPTWPASPLKDDEEPPSRKWAKSHLSYANGRRGPSLIPWNPWFPLYPWSDQYQGVHCPQPLSKGLQAGSGGPAQPDKKPRSKSSTGHDSCNKLLKMVQIDASLGQS